MDSWIPIVIIIVIALFLIGNLSTVHKSAKKPIRKQALNDLKETLPRTTKKEEKLPSFKK